MNTQNITLYFKDTKSDKQYNASLEKSGKQFIVNFAYGKRGGNLKEGTKTKVPVSYEKAKIIYDKLVKSKTDNGYAVEQKTATKTKVVKSTKAKQKKNSANIMFDKLIKNFEAEKEVLSLLKEVKPEEKENLTKLITAYFEKNYEFEGKKARLFRHLSFFFLPPDFGMYYDGSHFCLDHRHHIDFDDILPFFLPDWFESSLVSRGNAAYLDLMKLAKGGYIDLKEFEKRIPINVADVIFRDTFKRNPEPNIDNIFIHKETLETHLYEAFAHPHYFYDYGEGVWFKIFMDLLVDKKLDRKKLIDSIYKSNYLHKTKDKRSWRTLNTRDSKKFITWNFELLDAMKPTKSEMMPLQNQLLEGITSAFTMVKQWHIEMLGNLMSEKNIDYKKFIKLTKVLLPKATGKEITKILKAYSQVLQHHPSSKKMVFEAAKEGLKNSVGVQKNIKIFFAKHSDITEKELKATQAKQQKPKELTKSDLGGLSLENIEKVSQLLLSADDGNTKVAMTILENQAFPKVLLTEIFSLYKMTNDGDLRKKAFDILKKHGSKNLQEAMDSEYSLGEVGGGYTTEKTILKNIKTYVENNELDGVKLAQALYRKYGTGVTYLLQEAPKERQVEIFKTFLNGSKLKLNGKALTKLPPTIFDFPDLTEIDLSNNKIGSIPAQIGVFTKLKVLKLGKNKIRSINKNITKLTKLEVLYLNNNVLKDGVPSSIFELTELRKLDLTECKNQRELHEMPMNIVKLKKLEEFKLDFFNWGGQSDDSYSNYPQIKEVTGNPIDMNPLAVAETAFDQGDLSPISYIFKHGSEKLIKKVLNHFYDAKTKTLDFKEHFVSYMPDEIISFKIKTLNLRKTGFGSDDVSYEPELAKIDIKKMAFITKLKDLENLILDRCQLKGIADLSGLTNLKKLSIAGNYNIIELFDFTKLQNLEELTLGELDLERLPEGLFKLKNLKRLRMQSILDYKDGDPTAKDFEDLKNLKKLEFLGLRVGLKNGKKDYETIGTYLPKDCEYVTNSY